MINALHRVFLYRAPDCSATSWSAKIHHPYDLCRACFLTGPSVCVKEANDVRSDTHTHTHTEVFNEKSSAVIIFGQPPRPKKWNWGGGGGGFCETNYGDELIFCRWLGRIRVFGAVSPGLKIIFWHGGLIRGCGSINVPSPVEPAAVSHL